MLFLRPHSWAFPFSSPWLFIPNSNPYPSFPLCGVIPSGAVMFLPFQSFLLTSLFTAAATCAAVPIDIRSVSSVLDSRVSLSFKEVCGSTLIPALHLLCHQRMPTYMLPRHTYVRPHRELSHTAATSTSRRTQLRAATTTSISSSGSSKLARTPPKHPCLCGCRADPACPQFRRRLGRMALVLSMTTRPGQGSTPGRGTMRSTCCTLTSRCRPASHTTG